MRYSVITILMSLMLSTAMLQAQRSGAGINGGSHGNLGRGPNGGRGSGFGAGRFQGDRDFNHRRRFGFGAFWPGYYGYWDGGYSDDLDFAPNGVPPNYAADDQAGYAPENPSSQPMVGMSRQVPPAPAQSPKLLEIPLPKDAVVKPQPPTLFVLNDGEQLESRRYVLSVDSLKVQVGHEQRVIPVGALNVNATIVANQQRGIDVSIPQDRSSLFIGF